jgi:hypothetical protein
MAFSFLMGEEGVKLMALKILFSPSLPEGIEAINV